LKKLLLGLFSLLFTLVVADIGFGAVAPSLGVDTERVEDLRTFLREGHKLFRPFPYSGFVARTTDEQATDPTRPRDWAFELEKKPDVVRIACLGGSTTHGKYPLLLKEELERDLGREVEVMNWGVPGWTSQETLVNYVTTVQDYRPDVVVIHHSLNDVAPRRWQNFRRDYAHYRRPWQEPRIGALERWLILHSDLWSGLRTRDTHNFTLSDFANHPFDKEAGAVSSEATEKKLPAGTDVTFRRNVETLARLAELRGARVALVTMPCKPEMIYRGDGKKRLWAAGVEQHNTILRELAKGERLLVDTAAVVSSGPQRANPMFIDRVHLTQEGARAKARMIADALIAKGWTEPGS